MSPNNGINPARSPPHHGGALAGYSQLSEQLKNVIERVVLLPVRLRHRRGARPKHKARIAALATTTATLQKALGLKAESTCTVYNVALYLLLLDQDLAYFTDDLVYAIGDRRS